MLSQSLPIVDLVPTQVTVGMREVYFKRRCWRDKDSREAASYLNTHRLPVVLGPHARHYLIDRHHLALALHDEGIGELPVSIIANMSGLNFEEFWTTLEGHNWVHPFDDEGRRRSYEDMPASADNLTDDAFRSLAGHSKDLVDTPRTNRLSVNSDGRTSCAAVSRVNWSNAISVVRWCWL